VRWTWSWFLQVLRNLTTRHGQFFEELGSFDGDCITDIAEEVGEIVMNIDKFLPNIICEEYEYNECFEKNENSLPTEIQERDTNLSFKNGNASFAVFAEFPYLCFLCFFCRFCIHYCSAVKQNKIHDVYQQPTNAL